MPAMPRVTDSRRRLGTRHRGARGPARRHEPDALPAADRHPHRRHRLGHRGRGPVPRLLAAGRVAAAAPLELLQVLDAHDAEVLAATDSGRAGRGPTRWPRSTTPQGLLGRPTPSASRHKAGLDVSTLDDLLDRLDTYDAALVDLYTSLEGRTGRRTPRSAAALDRVNAAQESLPTDQAAMVVIVSDLAGPTITPILLSIESAARAPWRRPSSAAAAASRRAAAEPTRYRPAWPGPMPSDGVSS